MENQAGTIFTIYGIMMFLIIGFIPLVVILVMSSWLVRTAKRQYKNALK